MLRITVRRRILLFLLIVATVPLVIANGIWLLTSQAQLRKDAAAQQKLLVKSSANEVNNFLVDKINAAIIHSQIPGVQNLQISESTAVLSTYLQQDPDVQQIALVNAAGKQVLSVTRTGSITQIVDVSDTDAFRVVTFLGGEEYIGPVNYDAQHNGTIEISIPITNYAATQNGINLSTSQPGVTLGNDAIKGALIVKVGLQQLWNAVLNDQLGRPGYSYVTDSRGNLIAYPDGKYSSRHSNLETVAEVKKAIGETVEPGVAPPLPAPSRTISETGEEVLSSHYRVLRTGWIVITEEPIASVDAPVNNDIKIAAVFFVLSLFTGLVLVALTARSLLRPIHALSDGANKLAKGELSARIELHSFDEFGLLAKTFNAMAAKLSADIAKLENLDKLKNEFITIASHNLRTPLTVINGSVDMLRAERLDQSNRNMVEAIDKASKQLSAFSEDLLTISSIESGTAQLRIATITADDLVMPLREEYSAKAEAKGVRLVWTMPNPLEPLHLSPDHIRSALSNLLTNALEFTNSGGEIEVSVQSDAQNYIIAVRDTGSGIDPEELQQLFTKFHRGTSVLRYDHPGIGIGLYLTLLIIEAHHGRITVRSELNQGAQFTIYLPKG